MGYNQWRSQRGARGGTWPPRLHLKFPIVILRDWHRKKKGRKWLPETWKWFRKRKKKKKKNFSNIKSYFLFTYFTVLVSFSFVPRLTPISQFFSFLISIILFTVHNTFCSILLLNDARDITNFTIYILQISISPITKNIHKHLFIILFK